MTEDALIVVALLKVDKDKIDALKKELAELQKQTRLEEGCISYNLHQSLDDEAVFMFYETWKTRADLDKHLHSPHFKDWSKKEKEYISGPAQILMLKKIS